MVRFSILVMVLLSGCVAVGDEPTATIEIKTNSAIGEVEHATTHLHEIEADVTAPDLCAQASELPATDVCSLICDPPAMAAYLIDEGMQGGTCYQLRCVLPGNENAVMVGVCLAP